MGPGASGREFIHGLTRGRDLAPGELGPNQTTCRQTWSLAFYNPTGGEVLGRVWKPVIQNTGAPDVMALPFPVGTVAVKLVFTDAGDADAPTLAQAPKLTANVGICSAPTPRAPTQLRLLQLDIAVREERATYKTGWVFMSFAYDGRMPGRDPWKKLAPIGLMWGNDPQLSDDNAAAGAKPRQSVVFDAHNFGRGGRMNGPADERGSACSSCHMAAQWPTVAPMTAPAAWSEARCWFRNLDARYTFGLAPGEAVRCADKPTQTVVVPLDFSLQLTTALRNWSLAHATETEQATALGRLQIQSGKLIVNGVESLPLKR